MSNALVNHNDDIARLVKKGMRSHSITCTTSSSAIIPYLDNERRLQSGAFVTKFVDVGNDRIVQENHQIFFAGTVPHRQDGTPIPTSAEDSPHLH